MASHNLVEFITDGLAKGKTPGELQAQASQELGATSSEFSEALDLAMFSAAAPIAAPVPASRAETQIYQTVDTPAPASGAGSFKPFGWFKHHKLATGLIVLIGILGIGGYVAANMLLAPSIGEVRALVFDRLQNLKTVEYQGSLEGEVTTDAVVSFENFLRYGPQPAYANADSHIAGSKNTKVRLDFNGAADVRDLASPKSEFSLTLTAEGFVVGVETKSLSKDLYFKVTQLPTLGMFDVGQFLNQWFRLDYEALGLAADNYAPADDSMTKEQSQRILDILKASNVFQFAEKINSEEIDGKAAYHYRYVIDEVALLDTILKVAEVTNGSAPEVSVLEREQFLDWLDAAGGEIWLAKRDLSPLKLTFDMSMRSIEGAPVTGRFSFSILFKKYNEDISIEAPYPFINLSEKIGDIVSLNETSPSSRDAQRYTDIRQIQTALELYFNDYGSYPNDLGQLLTADSPILFTMPVAPEPPDGTCTPEQNDYKYKLSANRKDYQLTFCLGAKTSAFNAGARTGSASGIR